MKKFKSLVLFAAALMAFSCKPQEPTPVPQDPQAPEIVSATLRGLDGELKVKVGKQVRFAADVTVKNSELSTYTVEVKNGEELLATAGGVLKGTSAKIDEVLSLNLDATALTAELTPSVYFKVTNTDDMYTEKNLPQSDVVTIFPPELLPQMYLVDNNGKVFEMNEMAQKGRYRTYADISEIGTSLTVCENVVDGKPDGESWPFDTPVSEYGLRWIGFDAISLELFKEIDLTLTLDYAKMDTDAKKYKVFWCQELVPDCEVVFLNYPDQMLLQSDRFADVEENKARYTGNYSDKFEVYCVNDEKTNWLTIKGQWSDNSVVWVTGENGSAPMVPYCEGHPMNWFEGNPACAYSALVCVRNSDNVYSCLMYLKENYAFKIFDYWAWANELAWTSTTPGTMIITPMEEDPETGKVDGNYANMGPEFTEGLWTLTYNKLTKEASLTKYTGRIAAPVKGVQHVDPEPPVPTDAFCLVDKAGNAWPMSVVEGTKYLTDESLAGISESFVFAEKVIEGAIDWSGKVYGMKNGAVSEITKNDGDYIPLDPAYAVYNKSPWQLYFDTTTKEITYKEGFWKNGMGDMGDGSLVIWVQTLPHNAEVHFFDFDKPVSQTVNLAVFDQIDDANCVARYIGYSENYEAYYRKDQGWLILSNNICAKQKLLIGKNASFGQAPYTEYPIIETDIPRTAGQTLPLNRLDEHNYSAYIYMADNASFQLYTDYAWGALNQDWTSTTPGIVTRENFYAKLGADFYPGLYQITYNDSDNTFTLVAKSSKPEPKPIETLYLVNADGKSWEMELVDGTHFCTKEGASEVGSSFVFAEKVGAEGVDWSGRVFGMKDGHIAQISVGGQQIAIDPAYAVHGKTPWKIGFDVESMEVIYREGLWRSGMGAMGDDSFVIWVQTLPHNCEVFFFDFGAKVSEMVNLAVFDKVDDAKACARYIGVSENYEVYYRQFSGTQGWLILSNNICAKQKLLIGKNASFGQAPYAEYPIIETDIPRTAGQTLPLNRVDNDTYSAYIYMGADSSFQLYTDYAWGALNQEWTSDTPGIVIRENFYAKLGPDFTPGVYKITYKESTNTFTLTAK